jgi:hypothetical protein
MLGRQKNVFISIKIFIVELAATVMFVAIVFYAVGYELKHLFFH